jgi:hypothetical protein
MGTRADFYIGRGKNATWLGSTAWDGYPSGVDVGILEATTDDVYRELVHEHIKNRDDGTLPEHGWPWPWNDSRTTDYSYAFDEGKVWASCFGREWQEASKWNEQGYDTQGEKVEFPDMTALKNVQFGKKSGLIILGCLAAAASIALCSCASHEVVTVEHKGKVTILHHRSNTSTGTRDRIEAIDAKGAFSQAEVHSYDIGRLPRGDHGVDEAHRYYEIVQSQRPNLSLPRKVTGGPRTSYVSPIYSPMPKDQRINDAVSEANEAKKKLDDARANVEKRLSEDNSLRGQLQDVEDQNQALQDKLSAAMATPNHKQQPTEAEKEAQESALSQWGKSQQ